MSTARPSRLPISLRTGALATCVAVLGGVLVATASADAPNEPPLLVAAAETGRTALPVGSTDRSRAGLERTAVRLASLLDAVPLREAGPHDADDPARFCPRERLRVQWTPPGERFAVGGHVDPVGPAPTADTESVNGLVVCEGVDHAYMGFEARWDGATWDVAAVPALSDEHDLHGEGEPADEHADEHAPAHPEEEHEHVDPPPAAPAPTAAPAPPAAPAPVVRPASLSGMSGLSGGAIDAYAGYDPQRTCDPVGKPGAIGLRDLLLRSYPVSRSLGVSRTCTARGVSEHKEGRAFDWGVDVGVPAQRAAAESAISQLMATDAAGNRHALARRLGVMYVIWNRQIWSAYNPGWRAYSGRSPHTDHVHISLSWAGAMGRTSFWRGEGASLLRFEPGLQLAPMPTSGGTASGSGSSGSGSDAPTGQAPVPAVAVGWKGEGVREEDLDKPARRNKHAKQAARREDEQDESTAATGQEAESLPAPGEPPRLPEPPKPPKPAKAAKPAPQERPAEVRRVERPAAERARPERVSPERAKPERAQPERAKPERAQPERAQPERAKPARPKPKAGKAQRPPKKAQAPRASKPPKARGGKGGGKGKR